MKLKLTKDGWLVISLNQFTGCSWLLNDILDFLGATTLTDRGCGGILGECAVGIDSENIESSVHNDITVPAFLFYCRQNAKNTASYEATFSTLP